MANLTPPVLDLTDTPCASCNEVSTENEEMIGCDGCQRWFHTRCAEITADGKKEGTWYCTDEACQRAKKKKTRSKRNGDDSDRSSVKSDRALTLENKLKLMEEKQKRMEQELEMEMKIKKKEMEFKRAIEMKRMLMEKELRDKEEEEEKLFQEKMLQQRKEQFDRMKARQQSFADEMKDLDEAMSRLKPTKETSHVAKPVYASEGTSGVKSRSRSSMLGKLTEQNLAKLAPAQIGSASDDEEDDGDETEHKSSEYSDESDSVSERSVSTKKSGRLSQHGQPLKQSGPTRVQLAARSGVSKKLPTFTGKPEEWPLFYGMYQASNEACGFSDIENLVRLQECLKGPALEMVRGQLLLPKSVPKVIAKLRQLYGRPEQLLQSHLEKVHKLEPPKAGKLASFIPFGTAVEQLCEHLEAAELKQHLINPLLIQDLVEKLPDSDKREWVRFKRGKRKVTLRTFTDFISEIVSEACEANVSMDYKPTGKFSSDNRTGKTQSKAKEKGAVFNHSEGESCQPGVTDRNNLKPCRVCQRTDHRLRYCQDFKNLSYTDRMKVVDRWKLCHVCLNEHGSAQCKFKLRCNVGECRQPHNYLLHPIDGVIGTTAHIRTNNVTLFRMIPISLHCGETSITVLAFLDEGASVTLVERSLADRLGVVGVHEKLTIKWTADIARVEKDSKRMNVWVSAVGADEKLLLKTVRTVEKLMLPAQALDAEELSRR